MYIPVDWHSAADCLQLVRWLLFLSLTISSLQNISNSPAFGPNGLFAWEFQKYAYRENWLESAAFDIPFGQTGFVWLNLLRIGLLAAGFTGQALPIVLPALLLVSAVIYLRAFLPMSGADQLNTILLFCLIPSTWFPSPAIRALSLCTIAGQVLICYFSNGLLKSQSRGWFDGSHLKALLQTGNYSRKWAARLAANKTQRAFRLPGSVIVLWELSAVVAPFLPATLLWIFLATGILFHLTIAFIMGLNTFFWSYISTYPAILFTWQLVDHVLRPSN
jgi:hypothetical protein